MKKIKYITGVLVVFYTLLAGFIFAIQEKLFFHPSRTTPKFKYPEKNCKEFFINKFIHGIWISSKKNNQVVVYFHGNRANMEMTSPLGKLFNKMNHDFISYDYRGYGKSGGNINSEKQLINDAQQLYDWVITKYKPENIILIGNSIGTGIATQIAEKNTIKKIILLAPYYSLNHLKDDKNYFWIPNLLVKYPMKTYQYLPNIKVPIYIIHGMNDETIDVKNSLKLHQLTNYSKLFLVKNQGHTELLGNPKIQKIIHTILTETNG